LAATAWLACKVAQTEVGRVGSGGKLLSPAPQVLLVDPPEPVVIAPSVGSLALLAPPLPADPLDPLEPGFPPAVGLAPPLASPWLPGLLPPEPGSPPLALLPTDVLVPPVLLALPPATVKAPPDPARPAVPELPPALVDPPRLNAPAFPALPPGLDVPPDPGEEPELPFEHAAPNIASAAIAANTRRSGVMSSWNPAPAGPR